MYLDRKFGLNRSLSEITLLFDLSLYLDQTLAQQNAQRKAKSKVKVARSLFVEDVEWIYSAMSANMPAPDPEAFVQCPYEQNHKVRNKRLQIHLFECRKVNQLPSSLLLFV